MIDEAGEEDESDDRDGDGCARRVWPAANGGLGATCACEEQRDDRGDERARRTLLDVPGELWAMVADELASPSEPLQRRRRRETEIGGDAVGRATVRVVQHQHLAVARWDTSERTADVLAQPRAAETLLARGLAARDLEPVRFLDEHLAAPCSQQVAAAVARDRGEPGTDRGAIADLVTSRICDEKRLLDDVLGERVIVHGREGDDIHVSLVALDQRREVGEVVDRWLVHGGGDDLKRHHMTRIAGVAATRVHVFTAHRNYAP